MAQHQKKVGILFELGEVQINRTRWPDYRQYGFGHDDIDDLLELAVDLSLHGARVESNEVWAPLHAWRALGQLADLRAIEPLLRMFDTLCADDWAMEELPVVLAMMGPKAIGPIADFVADSSHKEYARMMAVDALEAHLIYLHASLALKQQALNKTTPTNGSPGRFRLDDALLAFLKSL